MSIFIAKTSEGYIMKNLVELLKNVVKDCCIRINKKGIFIQATDSNKRLLVDLSLDMNRFDVYEVDQEEEIFIGVTTTTLHKMMKIIKKKDSITFKINKDNPDKLQIISGSSTSAIFVYPHQQIQFEIPVHNSKPIVVDSTNYYRNIKEICAINTLVNINIRKYSVNISSSTDNMYSKETIFGELNDTSLISYFAEFDSEQFQRILKISNLSEKLYIYSGSDNLPLRISSNVGNIGNIDLFIKSKSQY